MAKFSKWHIGAFVWSFCFFFAFIFAIRVYSSHPENAQNFVDIAESALILAGLFLIEPGSASMEIASRLFFMALILDLKLPSTGNDWSDLWQIIAVLSLGTELMLLPADILLYRETTGKPRFLDWLGQFSVRILVYFCIDLVILSAVFLFLKAGAETWWPVLAVLFFVSAELHGIVDKLVVVLSGRTRDLPPLKDKDLPQNLADLISRSGQKVNMVLLDNRPGICIKTNPATIGLGKNILQGSEAVAEFILGHELGHAADSRYKLESMILSLCINLAIFWCFKQILLTFSLGHNIFARPQSLTLVILFFYFGNVLLCWLPSILSRRCEKRADLYSLELNESARGMIEYFTPDGQAEKRNIIRDIWDFPFNSHPSAGKRLAFAIEWQRKREIENPGCF